MLEVVLASASPRRAELLTAAGLAFRVEPSRVDESAVSGVPEALARRLAELKARDVAARHAGREVLVLGADTVVAVGERTLGKPRDAEQAAAMLRLLSGSRHRVVTGVAVVRGLDGELRSAHERTWVRMRPLEPDEIAAYVQGGEWRDKAGGYAIQESAEAFVTGLEGRGFDNVVGLPVELALGLLRDLAPGGRLPGAPPGSLAGPDARR